NMPTHVTYDIVDEFQSKDIVSENMDDRLMLDKAFKGRTAAVLLEKLESVGYNGYAMQLMSSSPGNGRAADLWHLMNAGKGGVGKLDSPLSSLL
ncbi:MAG: hypothetical protein IKY71_06550, partial [Bacteroidaceae bacterium]|nr:hypothetical protein [Bacteroidaceae bacterium]